MSGAHTTKLLTVVWFKRDLRIHDYEPLSVAATSGRILPLYIVESEYWRLPDTSFRHWEFLRGSLVDLETQIAVLGGSLCVRQGDAVSVLKQLRCEVGDFNIVSHMETGNVWTFDRDKAVVAWCRENSIAFKAFQQFGVWRGAELNRNKWAKSWDKLMSQPVTAEPKTANFYPAASVPLPTAEQLGLQDDGISSIQAPGRKAALETLNEFLFDRGEQYQKAMSSPVSGETARSKLSPYIAMGTLSMCEIYQATVARQAVLAVLRTSKRGTWPSAMKSFVGWLHWHCHFIQKLEAEPELERLPMARTYEGLRPERGDPDLLQAFEVGMTGFPFVDACMRYLWATGWINFRMRAMLMAFASHNLWLPWQQTGDILARLFTDYEPGIHWPQCQMQSGETGINTVRVYSPVKQGYDQDPTGEFTRQWVPELQHLAGKELQEPWLNGVVPANYPERIVDHIVSAKSAKEKIYALRRTADAKIETGDVFVKHGSRKRRRLRTFVPKPAKAAKHV